MEPTQIRAVELVRAIRDQLHEETKHLSREELKAFYAHEAAAARAEAERQQHTRRSA
jgi:hypothetical protein